MVPQKAFLSVLELYLTIRHANSRSQKIVFWQIKMMFEHWNNPKKEVYFD